MTAVATLAEKAWIQDLLRRAGWPGPDAVVEMSGGRNNRVFRVATQRGPCLLKRYFRESSDPRDRLSHEYGLLEACRAEGVDQVPRGIARDDEHGAALYEFVSGQRPERIGESEIREAAGFIEKLNAARGKKSFQSLPAAAEACFSLSSHLASVERRISRLEAMERETPVDRAAREWVQTKLAPAWGMVRESLTEKIAGDEPLSRDRQIVSPSDFGIHNALRRADGTLVFLDFEYAGWDDPAKLVCDFANQPDHPLSPGQSDLFVARLLGWLGESHFWRSRFAALAPVYQLKWACIVLNDFLPYGCHRRSFQGIPSREVESRKEVQLAKAGEILARIHAGILPLL